MDYREARAALEALGMSQVELAAEMARLTGKKFSATTVNKWFIQSGRGPSDACAVYLRLKLDALERTSEITKADVMAYLEKHLGDCPF